jgi:hypothetical protein
LKGGVADGGIGGAANAGGWGADLANLAMAKPRAVDGGGRCRDDDCCGGADGSGGGAVDSCGRGGDAAGSGGGAPGSAGGAPGSGGGAPGIRGGATGSGGGVPDTRGGVDREPRRGCGTIPDIMTLSLLV